MRKTENYGWRRNTAVSFCYGGKESNEVAFLQFIECVTSLVAVDSAPRGVFPRRTAAENGQNENVADRSEREEKLYCRRGVVESESVEDYSEHCAYFFGKYRCATF